MTDFGRRVGQGDMLKAVYDPNDDGVIALLQTEADMKKSVYDPNADGVIALLQTEADMKKSVYDPNADGVLAVAQTEADMKKSVYDANDDGVVDSVPGHKTSHQDAGADEIDATALVGRKNYVDQGDPSGAHYMTGTFTTDGNWHDLDLSSKVPAGATVVHLLLNMRDNLANVAAEFRKNGNSNEQNIFWQRTQVANISILNDFFLACDANRVIEYRFSNTTWSYIQLQVRGWLI